MRGVLASHVAEIVDGLASHGYEAYCVGGCVRDTLLGAVPKDWDVCTNATPGQVVACFSGWRVLETGLRHGTVTIMAGGQPIEVTTYRVDGMYTDHRRPDAVTFTGSLREDLARRDFTINAMAFARDGEVIDFFGGQEDLRRGVLRCVGDPALRFEEDALRILRGLRFATRLGFAVEAGTADALLSKRALLRHVAAERVLTELCGMRFDRVDPRFLPVLQTVIPEIVEIRVPVGLDGEPALQLSALLRGLDAGAILTRLKASRALARRVETLACRVDMQVLPEDIDIRRLLREIGEEAAEQLLRIQQNGGAMAALKRIVARGDCYRLGDLALCGDDLAARGLAGAEIGATLKRLLDRVVEGTLQNDREALLQAVYFDSNAPS